MTSHDPEPFPGTTTVREAPVAGPIPLYQLTDWRDRHGLVAGITGRGFDLGLWSTAPVGEVMQRWRSFRQALAAFDSVVLGQQVHGVVVDMVGPGRGWTLVDGVDGWVTTAPGVLLTVTVADCIPVYLAVTGRGIALLHAGWRGTAADILGAGLARLLTVTGVAAADVIMHCGVGICGPCYEVGSEVMAGCGAPAEGAGPWHLDLRQQLALRAGALGIGAVSVSPWCSAHDRSSFYSHRASRGADGRMVAYFGMLRSD